MILGSSAAPHESAMSQKEDVAILRGVTFFFSIGEVRSAGFSLSSRRTERKRMRPHVFIFRLQQLEFFFGGDTTFAHATSCDRDRASGWLRFLTPSPPFRNLERLFPSPHKNERHRC